MRRFWTLGFLLFAVASLVSAQAKPTRLSDAQTAVQANLLTAEGKAYDQRLGAEVLEKHLAELRQCKPVAGGDFRSFWILMKLDGDGAVNKVLLYPATKLGACARQSLLKDKFLSPPRPAYWVSVYLKIAY